MLLWFHWWSVVSQLRPACFRRRTFFWLVVVLAALCTRQDLAGVTSFVRALGLRSRCYGCLLDFFHSGALCPDRLARVWTRLALKVHPGVERSRGRLVVLADGLKKGKCGRKMPAVKLLHQSGESNTKPSFTRRERYPIPAAGLLWRQSFRPRSRRSPFPKLRLDARCSAEPGQFAGPPRTLEGTREHMGKIDFA